MKFGHLELTVRSPGESAAFFADRLGFTLVADQGGGFLWIEKGGLEILLRAGSPDPGRAEIVFYTNTLAEDVARLESRGVALEQRGHCHHFTDLDGHRFQLVNPHDDHSGS